MAEMVRVNIGGKEPRYLPATDNKKQVMYIDVVENRRRYDQDQQQWVDLDPVWYEASFRGNDADLIRDKFERGDSIIIFGDKEKRVREAADGQTYPSTHFYVDSFGIDPRLSTFTLDRSRRQNRAQEATQSVAQEATQLASPTAPDSEVDPAFDAEASAEFALRVKQVLEAGHITPETADAAMQAWEVVLKGGPDRTFPTPVSDALKRGGATLSALVYVTSVAEQYAGDGERLSWAETETWVDKKARSEARATVASRLHDVVSKRYVDGAVADQVIAVWDDPSVSASGLGQATGNALRAGGANEAVVAYVSSVADEYAGSGHAKSWNEAAAAAGPAQPVDTNWALVNEARRDVAASASVTPGI
ncbi:single-stranded DNA-binding protein [Leucobacter sp. NPDC058333]|uniref:single-stranded DNA-binding protein n=1 Tax=Leucobacter sp. NPDC058333 TaxID=3346450 RepID=UPI0036656BDC